MLHRKGTVSKSSGPVHLQSYALKGIPITYKCPIPLPPPLTPPRPLPLLPREDKFVYNYGLERQVLEQARLRALSVSGEAAAAKAHQEQQQQQRVSLLPPVGTAILTPMPATPPSNGSTPSATTQPSSSSSSSSHPHHPHPPGLSLRDFEARAGGDPFEDASLQAINDLEELQSVLQPTPPAQGVTSPTAISTTAEHTPPGAALTTAALGPGAAALAQANPASSAGDGSSLATSAVANPFFGAAGNGGDMEWEGSPNPFKPTDSITSQMSNMGTLGRASGNTLGRASNSAAGAEPSIGPLVEIESSSPPPPPPPPSATQQPTPAATTQNATSSPSRMPKPPVPTPRRISPPVISPPVVPPRTYTHPSPATQQQQEERSAPAPPPPFPTRDPQQQQVLGGNRLGMGVRVLPPIGGGGMENGELLPMPPPPPPYFPEGRRDPPLSCMEAAYQLEDPRPQLTSEEMEEVRSIAAMGFFTPCVARAVKRLKQDRVRVVDFLVLIGQLEEDGFGACSAETALLRSDEDPDKARAYLKKVGQFKEFGFTEASIHQAYLTASRDWDAVLDVLTQGR